MLLLVQQHLRCSQVEAGPAGGLLGQQGLGCPKGRQAWWCCLRGQHGCRACPGPHVNPTRLMKTWIEAEEPGGHTRQQWV